MVGKTVVTLFRSSRGSFTIRAAVGAHVRIINGSSIAEMLQNLGDLPGIPEEKLRVYLEGALRKDLN